MAEDITKKLVLMKNLPRLANLYTTLRCNNNCISCGLGKKSFFRTIKDIKKEIILARNYSENIVITGAEPTIDKNFFSVMDIIKKYNFKNVILTSNGRMFSYDSFTDKVMKKDVITHFVISMHSDKSEIHEKITRVKGSFNQSIEGIKNIIKNNKFVMADVVISKISFHTLPSLAELIVSLGIKQTNQVYVRPVGVGGSNFREITPLLSEIANPVKKSIDIYKNNGIFTLTEGIPYCFMKNYEKYVGEKQVPDRKLFAGQLSNKVKYIINRNNKMKTKNCNLCKYNKSCGGFWKECGFNTNDVHPVKK